ARASAEHRGARLQHMPARQTAFVDRPSVHVVFPSVISKLSLIPIVTEHELLVLHVHWREPPHVPHRSRRGGPTRGHDDRGAVTGTQGSIDGTVKDDGRRWNVYKH